MNTPHQERFAQGVGYMLASAACVTVTCALGKMMSQSFYLYLLVFIRFFVPLLLVGWVALTIAEERICTNHLGVHLLRALFVVAGQFCLFYYLSHYSVLDGTLLYSTGPVFVPLIARLSHHAPFSTKTWVSMAISFTGVLCLLRPDSSIFNWSALIGLGSGFFNACSQVAFHSVSKKQSPLVVSLHMYTLCSLLCLIPLAMHWHDPKLHQQIHYIVDSDLLLLFIAFSVSNISNQMFLSQAYRRVTYAATIAPFMYMSIVFSGIIDWWLHHQSPDVWTLGGIVGIVGGGLCSRFLPENFHIWTSEPQE